MSKILEDAGYKFPLLSYLYSMVLFTYVTKVLNQTTFQEIY